MPWGSEDAGRDALQAVPRPAREYQALTPLRVCPARLADPLTACPDRPPPPVRATCAPLLAPSRPADAPRPRSSRGCARVRWCAHLHVQVYVALRQFTNFATAFPEWMRTAMVHTGVCHYLVLLKTAQGRVYAYDFGPPEGEIELPLLGKMEADKVPMLGYGDEEPKLIAHGEEGEIREEEITGGVLPEGCMLCGVSNLSLEDLRSFVRVQPTAYTLLGNDCRHFANKMVFYATGVRDAAACTPTSQLLHEHVSRLKDEGSGLFDLGHAARMMAYQLSLVEHCTAIRASMAAITTAAMSSVAYRLVGALAPMARLASLASKPVQVVATAAPKLRSVPAVVAAVSTAVTSGDTAGLATALGLGGIGKEAVEMGVLHKAGSNMAAQGVGGHAAAAASGMARHLGSAGSAIASAARATAGGATAVAEAGAGAMVAAAAGMGSAAAAATGGLSVAAAEMGAGVSAGMSAAAVAATGGMSAAAAVAAGGVHAAMTAAAGATNHVASGAQRLVTGKQARTAGATRKGDAPTARSGRVTMRTSRAGSGGLGSRTSSFDGRLHSLSASSSQHSLSLSARQLPSLDGGAKASRLPKLTYKELAPLQVSAS